MRLRLTVILTVLLSLLGTVTLYAQLGLTLGYDSAVDDNAFRNYEQLSDVVHQPRALLAYDHVGETSAFRVFYEGAAFLFSTYSQRQYLFHQAGLTGQKNLGGAGSSLSWGVRAGLRNNQDAYAYYDYRSAEGYLNLLLDGGAWGQWLAGGQLRLRRYDSLTEFDYNEVTAFLRGSLFVPPTRTTVIARIQIGQKRFTEPLVSEEVVEEVTTGTPGRGKGKGQGGDPGTPTTRVVVVESAQEAVPQWTAALRLAQSLGSRMGLAVEGAVQRNPQGGGRVLSGQDGGYEVQDELFDDPYGYDSDGISVELTRLLPWALRLRVGASRTEKRYDRPAYDLEGAALEGAWRVDTPTAYWISLQKTVAVRAPIQSLIFTLDVHGLQNRSNDAYFDYDNRLAQLGVTLSL